MEDKTKLLMIESKLNRWQKVIDNSYDARNPIVQNARDEVMQECINTIRAILES